ncbi:MAG: hypothetical protein JWN41_340, partial [Thermoleophilia bacterium]|nr:hypothetical protein [Thermoleophilia bacterium]
PTLLAVGAVALPLAAMVLDHPPGRENWIWPTQAGVTTAVGAGLGALLPAIAGATAGHGRGAVVGAIAGATASLVAFGGWMFVAGG